MSQNQKLPPEDRLTVTKVIGGPGTGKTTAVVGNPELEIDGLFVQHMDEYSLGEQLLVTFTKAGVDEAATRLKKMLGIPKKDLKKQIRTIHSHAYQKMGVENGQLVSWRNKKKWCERHNLEFEYDDGSDDLMGSEGVADGNAFFQINSWLNAHRLGPEDHPECPADWTGHQNLEMLLHDWNTFKEEYDKLEFDDMIEGVVQECVSVLREGGYGDPDIESDREYLETCRWDEDLSPKAIRNHPAFIDEPVMYVDECQDLTYLQWDWYLCQKLACEKVFLGGDDDQAIYGWAGADPEQLLGEEGDVDVLEKTYRIPAQVWSACQACIEQVDVRQDKDIEPVDDEGEFVALSNPYPAQVCEHITESDDTLILFRAKFHIDEFRKTLHDQGIPYKNMSTYNTWNGTVVKMRDILASVWNGETLTADEVKRLIEVADEGMIDASNPGMVKYLVDEPEYEAVDVLDFFKVPSFDQKQFCLWYLDRCGKREADSDLNWYQTNAIAGNLRHGLTDRVPEQVRIGTIHSAKGKEADTVILGTDSTGTILRNMEVDDTEHGAPAYRMTGSTISDEERRVIYVGMSRAKRKLVMAEGLVTPETTLRINAIVSGEQDV
ncbi:ATP-dependent helicase (plasmid) [Halorarum halophilum]|uniref:DNA 3'-5' helicase n=1 Tax=Halorarum halophilum TaxID=2743090 RepID=A0A7D5KW99_9EURY|nr:ATP-dependent helicase [Halobaculum halophilum]QLG30060.1 ATP-dependent helicase [Halobaculum halophilum]